MLCNTATSWVMNHDLFEVIFLVADHFTANRRFVNRSQQTVNWLQQTVNRSLCCEMKFIIATKFGPPGHSGRLLLNIRTVLNPTFSIVQFYIQSTFYGGPQRSFGMSTFTVQPWFLWTVHFDPIYFPLKKMKKFWNAGKVAGPVLASDLAKSAILYKKYFSSNKQKYFFIGFESEANNSLSGWHPNEVKFKH